jgi:hypothetical protein
VDQDNIDVRFNEYRERLAENIKAEMMRRKS